MCSLTAVAGEWLLVRAEMVAVGHSVWTFRFPVLKSAETVLGW